MAKKNVWQDELIELLKDDEVTEFYLARITDSLTPIIGGIFNHLVDNFIKAKLESLVERN